MITGAGKGGSSARASSCAQLKTPAASSALPGFALPMGLLRFAPKQIQAWGWAVLGSAVSAGTSWVPQQLCVCLVESRDMVTPVHGPRCPQRHLPMAVPPCSVTGSMSKGFPAVLGPRPGSQSSSLSSTGEAMTGLCAQALLMQDGSAVLLDQSLSTRRREGSPWLSLFPHASKRAFARHILCFLPHRKGRRCRAQLTLAGAGQHGEGSITRGTGSRGDVTPLPLQLPCSAPSCCPCSVGQGHCGRPALQPR